MHQLARLNPTLSRLLALLRLDVTYVRGEGAYLTDGSGRQYLDFSSQYGALPFGYSPPDLWAALNAFRDAGRPSLVQPSVPEESVRLGEALVAAAPGDLEVVTFVQSGAEAVEAAIKLVRAARRRPGIVSTDGSFHGKTFGALSATGQELYQRPFFAPAPHFYRVPYADVEAVERLLSELGDEIAALIVEPVQAEAGVIVPPPGYLAALQETCRRRRVLLVIDEVQTGLGRCGMLFACERDGVTPDVLLLAKGLGGGLVPLGACLSRREVWTDEFGLRHSSTFANNNLTCALGLATLARLTRDGGDLVRQVAARGRRLLEGLQVLARRYPAVVKEVRGLGLLAAVEFQPTNGSDSFHLTYFQNTGGFIPLLASYLLHAEGLRTLPFFNSRLTLRLEPPLVVDDTEVDRAVEALGRLCDVLVRRDYVQILQRVVDGNLPLSRPPRDYRASERPVRAAALPRADESTRRFAFVIHYPGVEDMRVNNPCFRDIDAPWLERLMEMSREYGAPGVTCHMPAVRSATGAVAEGWLIAVPYLASQMLVHGHEAQRCIVAAVDLARELGADVVGLGAFTSIVTDGGEAVCGRGVPITTGNSLTASAAIEAALSATTLRGIDPATARTVVVGASGSVGRLVSLALSESVKRITLVGNPRTPGESLRRLDALAREIYAHALARLWADPDCQTGIAGHLGERMAADAGIIEGRPSERGEPSAALARLADGLPSAVAELARRGIAPPVMSTVDLRSALREADLVISASSAAHALIGPGDLRSGAVVCDVARPPDVARVVQQMREDILVIDGGLFEFPDRICFGQNLGFRDGVNLACLTETVLLALEGCRKNVGVGRHPPFEDVTFVRELARRHGFRVSGARSFGCELSLANILAVCPGGAATG